MKRENVRWRVLTAFVGLLILLPFVLVACGGNQQTASPTIATPTTPARTPTPPPPRVVMTSPLVGMYTVTITQRDVAGEARCGRRGGKLDHDPEERRYLPVFAYN
jgi:hypothetical protein